MTRYLLNKSRHQWQLALPCQGGGLRCLVCCRPHALPPLNFHPKPSSRKELTGSKGGLFSDKQAQDRLIQMGWSQSQLSTGSKGFSVAHVLLPHRGLSSVGLGKLRNWFSVCQVTCPRSHILERSEQALEPWLMRIWSLHYFFYPIPLPFSYFISQIFIIKTALEAGDTISILEGQQGYPLSHTISRTQLWVWKAQSLKTVKLTPVCVRGSQRLCNSLAPFLREAG